MLISYKRSTSSGNPLTEAFLPKVYDAGFHELSDIRVERVVHTLGGEPSRAEFTIVLDSYHRWKDGDGNVHDGVLSMEQAIPPGTLSVGLDDVVIVAIPLGGGRVLVIFRGRIATIDASFSEAGEGATVTALGPRQALDNTDLRGAAFANPSGGILATDQPLLFNPDNLGNYDSAASAANGRPLFGDPVEPGDGGDAYAGHWHLGDFWRYVVGNFAPGGDSRLPSAAGVPELHDDDDAVLPPTDVDGMKPSQALDMVLGSYGLEWWADPFVIVNRWSVFGEPPLPSFRIVSPDAAPLKSVRLQEPGDDFSRNASNVNAGSMSFSTRFSTNHWRIEGDFKEYEACFELVKLWTDQQEGTVSGDPDKGSRAHEDYEIDLDHVYRQWGLNEDGHWSGRDVFDFETFFGEGTWTRRRRRFHHPYAETDDEPRKCIVEVKNTDLDGNWHRVGSATIRLLNDRCGIYFDMTDVDGTNARVVIEDGPPQALKDLTHVRITAIVQSDDRVTYDAPKQDSAASSQTITRRAEDDTFRWIKRHESSAYGSTTELVRDDAAAGGPMEEAAGKLRKRSESQELGVGFSMPWLDFTCRVGDRVTGLRGRDIELPTKPGDEPYFPMISRVTYDFRAQRTDLDVRPTKPRADAMRGHALDGVI